MNKTKFTKDIMVRLERLVQNYSFWRSFAIVVLVLSLVFIVVFSSYDVRWDILAVFFGVTLVNFILSFNTSKLARELSAFLTVMLAVCLLISLFFSGIFYLLVLI